ncbi:MAG: NAD-dependent epimerase/dehydratase family protein [Opitutaceae bacterium]|nr:NAD-dependent epimerase/dehydratase family protein [Opitutaceae bacterium]
MKILVTGAAGFVGSHVCQRLLAQPGRAEVLGIDNLNAYYSVALKEARLARLSGREGFRFVRADFADAPALHSLVAGFQPDYIVHLGAQAGVRYSLTHPEAYVHSNLVGFANILEAAHRHPPKHLVFASSSSVYGAGVPTPFREEAVSEPLSFYAATKRANEHMAYSYAHVHGLRCTGLRFFTVYGPWGRPDMTPILFARAILAGETIKLWNYGKYRRDFTFIDDIVAGILKLTLSPPAPASDNAAAGTAAAPASASTSTAAPCVPPAPRPPYDVFNIGHHRPVEMLLFVQMLETLLGKKAVIELHPPQPTEMPETCADLTRIRAAVGYEPKTSLEEGLRSLVDWVRDYYGPAGAGPG